MTTVQDAGCTCHYEPYRYQSQHGGVTVHPRRFDDHMCVVHRDACRCQEEYHPDGGVVRYPSRWCPVHSEFEQYRTGGAA